MTTNKTESKPEAKPTTPVHLTVERARDLLNTKRELIFEGIDDHMTPEEKEEMLQIEAELGWKRSTYSTTLAIATREHPAHQTPKAKAKKKPKPATAAAIDDNETQLDGTWQPEDNHDPFAEDDGKDE